MTVVVDFANAYHFVGQLLLLVLTDVIDRSWSCFVTFTIFADSFMCVIILVVFVVLVFFSVVDTKLNVVFVAMHDFYL